MNFLVLQRLEPQTGCCPRKIRTGFCLPEYRSTGRIHGLPIAVVNCDCVIFVGQLVRRRPDRVGDSSARRPVLVGKEKVFKSGNDFTAKARGGNSMDSDPAELFFFMLQPVKFTGKGTGLYNSTKECSC